MSFLGRAFSEGELFGLAFEFEEATHHRRQPDLNKVPSAVDPTLPEPPANDAFAERARLAEASGSVSGNHLLATVEIGEPRFNARPIDRTVWFTHTAAGDGNLIVDDAGSAPVRNDIVVYTGASLDRLELVSLSLRNSDLDAAEVSAPVRSGTTYHIVIGTDTYRVAGGHFFLNWRIEPSQ